MKCVFGARAALLAMILPLAASAEEPRRTPLKVGGHLVDSTGQPVKGAICLWVWSNDHDESKELLVETVTDAEGKFELAEHKAAASSTQHRAGGTLWFYADGHAVKWLPIDHTFPMASSRRNLVVDLQPIRKFSFRVVDPEGHSRLGELVEPIRLLSKQMMIPLPRPIREQLSGTTDDAGLFQVSSLSAEQGMIVRVISERFGTIQQFPNLTRGLPDVVTLQLIATGRVEGVLEGAQPGRFAGRRVQLTTSKSGRMPFAVFGTAETTLDVNGRFQAPLLGEGDLAIQIDSAPDAEFEPRPPRTFTVTKDATTKVRIPLIRMIPFSGRVTDAAGNVPAGDGQVILSFQDRFPEKKVVINAEGRFHGWAYPGDMLIRAEYRSFGQTPVGGNSVVVQKLLRIAEKADRVECPDLTLPKVRVISGEARGPDGQPLSGAVIYVAFGKSSGAQIRTDDEGRFEYAVGENTAVSSYMLMKDDRTLITLLRTDDPLVLKMRP